MDDVPTIAIHYCCHKRHICPREVFINKTSNVYYFLTGSYKSAENSAEVKDDNDRQIDTNFDISFFDHFKVTGAMYMNVWQNPSVSDASEIDFESAKFNLTFLVARLSLQRIVNQKIHRKFYTYGRLVEYPCSIQVAEKVLITFVIWLKKAFIGKILTGRRPEKMPLFKDFNRH